MFSISALPASLPISARCLSSSAAISSKPYFWHGRYYTDIPKGSPHTPPDPRCLLCAGVIHLEGFAVATGLEPLLHW